MLDGLSFIGRKKDLSGIIYWLCRGEKNGLFAFQQPST